MTALKTNFETTSGYGRILQRINALSDEDSDALDTVMLDADYASDEIKKGLDFARRGARKLKREQNQEDRVRDFIAGQKSFEHTKDMGRAGRALTGRKRKFEEKSSKYARAIQLGNIGLELGFDYSAGKVRKRTDAVDTIF